MTLARYHVEGRGTYLAINKEKLVKRIKALTYVKTDQKAGEYIFKDSEGRQVVFDVLLWGVAEECGLNLLR